MREAQKIRQQLDFARARAHDIILACDEAEVAIRSKDERRLRIFVGCAHAEALRLRGATNRACDALNRMPLDGLLRQSLEIVKR
jgi:hypothetical protein